MTEAPPNFLLHVVHACMCGSNLLEKAAFLSIYLSKPAGTMQWAASPTKPSEVFQPIVYRPDAEEQKLLFFECQGRRNQYTKDFFGGGVDQERPFLKQLRDGRILANTNCTMSSKL